MQHQSPRDILQTALQSEVSSGEIDAADQDALSSALDKIDSELSASRPTAGSKPPSPEDMQAKIDDMISQQVEAGTLTEEQGEELSQLFSDTFAKGPGGRGPGGPGGAGGPAGGLSGVESEDAEDAVSKMLTDFLKELQQADSSGYGADGNSSVSDASVLFNLTV